MKDSKVPNHKFKTLALFSKFDYHRDKTRVCPECNQDLRETGINKLAYTMDVCTCRKTATYDHVVEQLWHKECLLKHLTKHPEHHKDYRTIPS